MKLLSIFDRLFAFCSSLAINAELSVHCSSKSTVIQTLQRNWVNTHDGASPPIRGYLQNENLSSMARRTLTVTRQSGVFVIFVQGIRLVFRSILCWSCWGAQRRRTYTYVYLIIVQGRDGQLADFCVFYFIIFIRLLKSICLSSNVR